MATKKFHIILETIVFFAAIPFAVASYHAISANPKFYQGVNSDGSAKR